MGGVGLARGWKVSAHSPLRDHWRSRSDYLSLTQGAVPRRPAGPRLLEVLFGLKELLKVEAGDSLLQVSKPGCGRVTSVARFGLLGTLSRIGARSVTAVSGGLSRTIASSSSSAHGLLASTRFQLRFCPCVVASAGCATDPDPHREAGELLDSFEFGEAQLGQPNASVVACGV